jgi:glycerate 2-kinase
MSLLHFKHHRAHLAQIRRAALQAADPAALLASQVSLHSGQLQVGSQSVPLDPGGRILAAAFGKASHGMFCAAADILGKSITQAVVALPHGKQALSMAGVQCFFSGHPLPDQGSLAAGKAVAGMLQQSTQHDLLLALISGGGSAMIELPRPGVSLADLRLLNRLLLRSGEPIEAINLIRSSLSRFKAGGLARLAAPARVLALIISDVVGDRISLIASGPTVLRRPQPDQVVQILHRSGIWPRLPSHMQDLLQQPLPLSPSARRPMNVLVGTNRHMLHAAADAARGLGFPTPTIHAHMRGEACEVGRGIGLRLQRAPRPTCLLLGGETTVTLRDGGKGGRNQELAFAAALALEGIPAVAIMALASDGVDGPTDAAGALITGETVRAARRRGLQPEQDLKSHNVYPLLDAVGALIRSGPTGTNLSDIVVGLAYAGEADAESGH